MRRKPTCSRGQATTSCLIIVAVVPVQALFPLPLDAPLLVIVLRIVGPALAVQFALQTAHLSNIGLQLLAEDLQAGWSLTRDTGQCGGTNIQTQDIRAGLVLRFEIGLALNHQLYIVAM